uniref:LITAF domain-containing protein n=1 Tax=Oryzias melastigma TaxID=30732 RepID=A0A3B3DXE5_ORYME
VGVYHINLPDSPSPPPPHPSPLHGMHTTLGLHIIFDFSVTPSLPLRLKTVKHEIEFCRSPALMTCDSCQIQVTTQVSFRVGTHILNILSRRLFLGCCLIPFFVDHFKDVYHTCPHCQRVLHVHRRACFK